MKTLRLRTLTRVLIPAVMFWWACAASAAAPSRSFVAGLQSGDAALDLSPTNAAGEVLLSVVTNSSGAIRIIRFLPPDYDWRFRIASKWYRITYYGKNAPVASRGTRVMAFGHALRLQAHPSAIVSALGMLVLVAIVVAWKWTTKGASSCV